MAFFQCKYAFSNENMTFYINKRRRKTPYTAFSMQIRLFICLSEGVGCRQYVLNFKLFWIWSEGGESQFFNNFWNSKSSELSEGEGGQDLFWISLVTPPLIFFAWLWDTEISTPKCGPLWSLMAKGKPRVYNDDIKAVSWVPSMPSFCNLHDL